MKANYYFITTEIITEVEIAKEKYPKPFVNQHEAYAVILEEIDELWDEIKKKQSEYDLKAMRKEAVQASAMLIRLIDELL